MAPKKRMPDQSCDWHTDKPKLGYIEWHADAERRTAAGEKQKKCPDCGYYIWESQFGTKPGVKRRAKDAAATGT